ncbi:RDD family protein [Zooshikella harenae]
MEASKYRATFGKLAVGIVIVNENVERIGIWLVISRNILKWLFTIIFCPIFIFVAFSRYKQGVHDLIAHTYVVKHSTVK